MSHPSAPDLAERIAGLTPGQRELLGRKLRERGEKVLHSESIPPRPDRGTAPLSFAQQRLWFLDQLEPESISYNVARIVRVRGALDVEALRRALQEIVDRHEVLRSTFVTVDDRPVQLIAGRGLVSLALVWTDLTALSPPARETEAVRIAKEEQHTRFDLARGPMFRARLLRLAPEEHILVLTNHHIVSDAWSAGILFRELGSLYGAFSQGRVCPLQPLPIQYADFAEWQRGPEQGEALEQQLTYWRSRLEGVSGLLELPADRVRPAVQSFRGSRETLTFSETTSQGLRALSQKEEVTLFMTLLAGLDALLSRYTGREDIVVGSPIAGRTRPELEGLIGCFLNTLVLRTDLSGDPTFRELLGRVREVALGAYSHQELPFEKLVEVLRPERSLSHTPLFQVLLVFQNAPTHAPELPGLTVEPMASSFSTSNFDLTLSISDTGSALRVRAEYSVDLFDASTIARLLRHFETLLEGALADPGCPISRLPLLTEPEERQQLVEWNQTRAPLPPEGPFPRMFEAQAGRTPNAVAAVFEDEHWTYAQLNARANQIARQLQALGIGAGSITAICLERSLPMLASLLGILKAGAAYLPIDPDYPPERITFMMEDAPVAGIVTQRKLAGRFPSLPERVLWVDADGPTIASRSAENLPNAPGPEDLAYLIYTSGSTGRPKGVEIPHRALSNLLGSVRQAPGLTDRDVLLSVTTLSFDIAALELYLPLVTGARLVLVSRDVAADGARLLERIHRVGATTIQATPATWLLLLAGGWEGGSPARVLCGGEALTRELAERLRSRCQELWNLYGPTETTIWSAVHRLDSRLETPVAPIGRPIANTQMYVLDRHGRPTPIGVPGELYIGGSGVARGYWNRPELTREKFVEDTVGGRPGQKLYRTGDLARYRPDGTLEFLGRLDGQIKLRGFRVELGEVESVLAQHSGLREVAVVVREDTKGEKRLVAYTVPALSPSPEVSELRAFLARKVPEYMVPSAFVWMDRLPLTPNRKVDRLALAAAPPAWTAEGGVFVAPRTGVEESLARLWCGVLGLERVSVEDSFFDLGGHSLLATQLMSRIRHDFGIDLPLRALFEKPTVTGLALEIEYESSKRPATSIARLAPLSREARRMKRSDLRKD